MQLPKGKEEVEEIERKRNRGKKRDMDGEMKEESECLDIK